MMSQAIRTVIKDIDPIVTAAIDAYLGDISSLPRAVKIRIVEVYQVFFAAYLNIGRLKGVSGDHVLDNISALDQDLLDYMQHFFSDYQDLYHSFFGLNRLARELLKIDGAKYPKKFHEQIDALLAGQKESRDELVFKQLWSNQETDKKQG